MNTTSIRCNECRSLNASRDDMFAPPRKYDQRQDANAGAMLAAILFLAFTIGLGAGTILDRLALGW